MIHELPREQGGRTTENLPFSGRELGELAALVEDGTISVVGGRQILAEMVKNGGEPRELVAKLGLQQVSDPGALARIVDQVIAANAAKVDDRAGKTGLLGFFIGQVMRQSGGTRTPRS